MRDGPLDHGRSSCFAVFISTLVGLSISSLYFQFDGIIFKRILVLWSFA